MKTGLLPESSRLHVQLVELELTRTLRQHRCALCKIVGLTWEMRAENPILRDKPSAGHLC